MRNSCLIVVLGKEIRVACEAFPLRMAALFSHMLDHGFLLLPAVVRSLMPCIDIACGGEYNVITENCIYL